AGAGHAHLAALAHLTMNPLLGGRVTLVTPLARQIYSGMLPGLIAGHYRREETEIDVGALAERAYADVILDAVVGIDDRKLRLQSGAELPFDIASLNVGSRMAPIAGDEYALPAKPFEDFVERVQRRARTAVIGGGAAGAELAMALRHAGSQVSLYSAQSSLHPKLEERVHRALRKRGVNLIRLAVDEILPGGIVLAGKAQAEFEQVLLATGAAPHAWLGGFLEVDDTLRCVSRPDVFACGDCASQRGASYPRSGVYAVRHGELLARNLHHLVKGEALEPYAPQKNALLLLSCGARYAIAQRGDWTAEGRLLWHLKNRIDRRWLRMLNREKGEEVAPD
ncbi:MAG: FAD-dependent oxidoreductase, partial [Betaproteobacteria bacterium]